MAKAKQGIHGMTLPEWGIVLGTAVVCGGVFDNIKGEIIQRRTGEVSYLTVQVPSEYRGRVYILNLMHHQCKDIQWRDRASDISSD